MANVRIMRPPFDAASAGLVLQLDTHAPCDAIDPLGVILSMAVPQAACRPPSEMHNYQEIVTDPVLRSCRAQHPFPRGKRGIAASTVGVVQRLCCQGVGRAIRRCAPPLSCDQSQGEGDGQNAPLHNRVKDAMLKSVMVAAVVDWTSAESAHLLWRKHAAVTRYPLPADRP
jgi:hypothetical protein